MERFFNTAGPIIPEDHYHIPPIRRVDWDEIRMLISNKRYFVLHAPRQTGKTSTLLAIMEALNAAGDYAAVYANIEGAQAARENVRQGILEVVRAVASDAEYYLGDPRPLEIMHSIKHVIEPEGMFTELLTRWARVSEKPLVILLDEVDSLVGNTLISLLRQVRSGYTKRPAAFPQSVVLCGVRDVRDYRMHQPGGEIITGGSAFNIKAKSLRMGNFSEPETRELLEQHTRETGQVFEEAIYPELWEDTRGQPWLVNALGHEMIWEDRSARDRNVVIDLPRYMAARERLIMSRATHLDQLADKLHEERVRRVIEPLLANAGDDPQFKDSDLGYVQDLGLIVRHPEVAISNRIYQEVLPRELTVSTQQGLSQQQSWYLTPDHRLEMSRLLRAFQEFFRENSESWIERFDYKEAGPHLLMQAFLQRIINGGGRLHREYGLGRKRTDLLLSWPIDPDKGLWGPMQKIVIELKLQRGKLETMLPNALEQTAGYADTVGAEEAHLVIFDRRPDVSWDEKIHHSTTTWGGRKITVWGC